MSKVLQRSLEAKLAALKGPEWDSSSDEEEETSKKKLVSKKRKVTISKDVSSNKKNQQNSTKTKPSNVIYLGHLPADFEEKEINAFLSQFGSVLNVRLSRSRKTGRAKGYGFAEFVDTEVASIVAETMNGYFLLDKRLVCHVVPSDKVHPKLFTGAGRKFKVVNGSKLLAQQLEKNLSTAEGLKRISKNLMKRDKVKRKKLAALGIDYGYPELESTADSMTSSEKKKQDETPVSKKQKVESTKKKKEDETPVAKKQKVESTKKMKQDATLVSKKQKVESTKKTKQDATTVAKKQKVESTKRTKKDATTVANKQKVESAPKKTNASKVEKWTEALAEEKADVKSTSTKKKSKKRKSLVVKNDESENEVVNQDNKDELETPPETPKDIKKSAKKSKSKSSKKKMIGEEAVESTPSNSTEKNSTAKKPSKKKTLVQSPEEKDDREIKEVTNKEKKAPTTAVKKRKKAKKGRKSI